MTRCSKMSFAPKKTNRARPTMTAKSTTMMKPLRIVRFFNSSKRSNGLFSSRGGRPKNTAPKAYIIKTTDMTTKSVMFGARYGLNVCFNTF